MRKGVLLALATYLIWGLFPLYWPLAEPAGAVEILAHRMLWSAVVMGMTITVLRRWRDVRALPARSWGLIASAAAFISVNWGVYIYAVNNGHVVEASLGYFINPLIAVALGVIALGERLAPLQWAALVVAIPGVVLTALGAGGVPYLAFALAVSFGLYGLVKRVIRIPAAISMLGESSVLMLPALCYLIWLQVDGRAHLTGHGSWHAVVLVASGVVTAVPLLLFGAAARILPLSVLGFLQYLNPLTQFLLGVWWAGEQMAPSRWAGFAIIWISLILLSSEAVRRSRRRRREALVVAVTETGSTPAAGAGPGPAGARAPGGAGRPLASSPPVAPAAGPASPSMHRARPATGGTDEPA